MGTWPRRSLVSALGLSGAWVWDAAQETDSPQQSHFRVREPYAPLLVLRLCAAWYRGNSRWLQAQLTIAAAPPMSTSLVRHGRNCALRELRHIKAAFGLPMLVSVSRKSFLGAITGREVHEREAASLAAEIFCALQGADDIRTHDVRSLRDALQVMNAIGDSEREQRCILS